MNMKVVLGAMGLDPEQLEKQFTQLVDGVKGFDERLAKVESKQDEILKELRDGRTARNYDHITPIGTGPGTNGVYRDTTDGK